MIPSRILLSVWIIILLLGCATRLKAADMNFYDQCLLVPLAFYQANGVFSSVGIHTREGGTVHWWFNSSENSNIASGTLSVSANIQTPFVWSQINFGETYAGIGGSLLFCLDRDNNGRINSDDGDGISGNAFLVDESGNDVAFLPTTNIDDADLSEQNVNELGLRDRQIKSLPNGAFTDDDLDLQYAIDGQIDAGLNTRIVIWSNRRPSQAAQIMQLHNGDGLSQGVSINLAQKTLNIIDPEGFPGIGSNFYGSGFIRWRIPSSATRDTLYVFAFSIVYSPEFGATQTLLGNY